MKTLSLRGIDPVLSEKLKLAAKQKKKSVNQYLLDIIKKQLGMQKEKKHTVVHHDLDHLLGRWSEDEFMRIQGKIDSESQIDHELWK